MNLFSLDVVIAVFCLILLFIGLPILILKLFDLGKSLRKVEKPSFIVRILGLILGIPQALFALIAAISGTAIIGWVLYNSLIKTQPEYTGHFLTFGIGPVLIATGIYWIRIAFKSVAETDNEPDDNDS